jgi:hypothetical protein
MNFIQISGRDAHATFAGFVFQVNVTILRWLRLHPDQHLELEAGEDIDLIRKAGTDLSQDSRLLKDLWSKDLWSRFVVRRDWNFARSAEPATTLLKFYRSASPAQNERIFTFYKVKKS